MKLFDLFSADAVFRRKYSYTRPPTSKNHREKTAAKESSGAVTTSATGPTRPGAAPRPRPTTAAGPTDIHTGTKGNQPAPGRTPTPASHHIKGNRHETMIEATTVIPPQTNKRRPADSARAGVPHPRTIAATTLVTSRTNQPRPADSAPLRLLHRVTSKVNTAAERPKLATSTSADDGGQGDSKQPPSSGPGQGVSGWRRHRGKGSERRRRKRQRQKKRNIDNIARRAEKLLEKYVGKEP